MILNAPAGTADPFGTASIRQTVLDAWRASPTRFREDANAEEDLRLGGYAERLVVELAANAADAALAAGQQGTLRLSIVESDGHQELRVANTGAALDAAGVSALASLRASAKVAGDTVGRFGVGFAAVLAVSDEPKVLSTSGGVRFSLNGTLAEVGRVPELAAVLADRGGTAPVLRLPWPAQAGVDGVAPGFTTEVRLLLRSDVDAEELLADARAQASDLLLALHGLWRLEVGGESWVRETGESGVVTLHGPAGDARWLLRRGTGEFSAAQLGGLGVEARGRSGFWTCWAVPVDEAVVPVPVGSDVLHAPTPTDERLSLPARLLATLPVEPTRRRIQRGAAVDAVLGAAAADYPGLLCLIDPRERLRLVPLPGFPLSEVDAVLRDGVLAALAGASWLPAAGGRQTSPRDAVVLEGASADLVELLADVLPGLLATELAGPSSAKALAALGVRRISLADLVDALTGLARPPRWWRELYAALVPLADAGRGATEELGGLAVPLADGRTVTGPRTVLLPSAELSEVLSTLDGFDVVGLRIAHPEAVHPLLRRLGATEGGALDLLDVPALRAAVERTVADAEAGADPDTLPELVLRLVELAGSRPGERPWLGALALRDADGGYRRADELVLSDSPLLGVLDQDALGEDTLGEDALGEDGPLARLASEVAQRWPRGVLVATGVLDSFPLVLDEEPTAPEHDLPDEQRWWSEIGGDQSPPARMIGIRELDLVADDAWPAALRLLAGTPDAWRAIREPSGYPAWWLARYALLDGRPPRHWRMPGATALAGLYDPVPELGVPEEVLTAVGVRTGLSVSDAGEATELLARLADPKRTVSSGVTLRAHDVLAAAVTAGMVEPSDVEPSELVRTLAGTPVADAVVLDMPWLLGVLDADRVVATSELAAATALAELLDLPLASEDADVDVPGGDPIGWAELGAVALACELLGVDVPPGAVLVHDELRVAGRPVSWWVDASSAERGGYPHAEDSPEGLARALAWVLDRWPDRHLLTALLSDGDPTAYLA